MKKEDERKVNFNFEPIREWFDQDLASQANKVQNETLEEIKQTLRNKRSPKERQPNHGLFIKEHSHPSDVRRYPNTEIRKMNQHRLAEAILQTPPIANGSLPEHRRDIILRFMAQTILEYNYFNIREHASKVFFEMIRPFWGKNIDQYIKVSFYVDTKQLVKDRKVNKQGKYSSAKYFLGPGDPVEPPSIKHDPPSAQEEPTIEGPEQEPSTEKIEQPEVEPEKELGFSFANFGIDLTFRMTRNGKPIKIKFSI